MKTYIKLPTAIASLYYTYLTVIVTFILSLLVHYVFNNYIADFGFDLFKLFVSIKLMLDIIKGAEESRFFSLAFLFQALNVTASVYLIYSFLDTNLHHIKDLSLESILSYKAIDIRENPSGIDKICVNINYYFTFFALICVAFGVTIALFKFRSYKLSILGVAASILAATCSYLILFNKIETAPELEELKSNRDLLIRYSVFATFLFATSVCFFVLLKKAPKGLIHEKAY